MKQLPVVPLGPDPELKRGYLHLASQGVFTTFQGEGHFTGMNSVFLRLQGCSLACEKCDTKDTWHPLHYFRGLTPKLRAEDVADMLYPKLKLSAGRLRHLVITGGEPLLQSSSLAMMLNLVHASLGARPVVTVETNARHFDPLFAGYVSLASLSPKLGVWGDVERVNILKWLEWEHGEVNRHVQVKIVVENEQELAEGIQQLLQCIRLGLKPEMAFIHPEWSVGGMKAKWIAQTCSAAGVRIGGQAHKAWSCP